MRSQCSKLGFQFVQPLGAEGGKCVHPEFNSSAHKLRYTLNIRQHGAQLLKACTQHDNHARMVQGAPYFRILGVYNI